MPVDATKAPRALLQIRVAVGIMGRADREV